MLETVFDGWVQEAEQKLVVPGDYPLVDSPELEMVDELRTLANRVVDEYSGEVRSSNPSLIEPTIEFFENRLIGSQGALPVRFVILNFLYRLAHFADSRSETSALELYGVVWPHFGRFVGLRLQEDSVIKDPRAVRWEVLRVANSIELVSRNCSDHFDGSKN